MVTTGNRAAETRELILATAERLFAERGVFAVSNRQVGEEAGQGNNFAVGYHFGTKADLVRAIVRRHTEPMERTRERMLAEVEHSREPRDWVACLVRPYTAHLAELGNPTWFARFSAQVMTDPGLRQTTVDEALATEPMRRIVDGLNRCLPAVPLPVHLERGAMARNLISHTLAEREAALAAGAPTPKPSWDAAATSLIDAIVGLLLAPVTPTGA
ncbi:TetR/AcrR family transcriptional regulator [Saccharothrix longispora]|uniref:TetR/AcrR family transcriptional regulator n=1 Tax=Saccharothrix longispora TaxID=33920 RepID=UPI0028FD6C1E|nr:TetR/AcrR family transcriptional regulator [Saccharothrix longispora]MBY8851580.1 TetR/AcrR family transcriptional regulator [Saccharothrix sp. MB29]MDU0293644.1 TetR/AcrR family transcriptional regulator [Saccharothrix longispora]